MSIRRLSSCVLPASPHSSPQRHLAPAMTSAALTAVSSPGKMAASPASPTHSLSSTYNSLAGVDLFACSPVRDHSPLASTVGSHGNFSPSRADALPTSASLVGSQRSGMHSTSKALYRTAGSLNKKTLLAQQILEEELPEDSAPRKKPTKSAKQVKLASKKAAADAADEVDSDFIAPWLQTATDDATDADFVPSPKKLTKKALAAKLVQDATMTLKMPAALKVAAPTFADAAEEEADSDFVAPWLLPPVGEEDSAPIAKDLARINTQVKLAQTLVQKHKISKTFNAPVVAAGDKHRGPIKGQNVRIPSAAGASLAVVDVPFLLAQWVGGKRSKMISPIVEDVTSVKKLQWQCLGAKCSAKYEARIDHQYANGGKCPSCKQRPEAAMSKKMADGKRATYQAEGSSSMRNFNPELAKGWDKCHGDIDTNEALFVSPKLDGIRCVAFNAAPPGSPVEPKFFSRRGNALECCDHMVPIFQKLFERDPEACFDGELYSHSLKDNFDAMGGAARVFRKNRSEEQHKVQLQLQYHCFGMMYGRGITSSTTFAERYQYLKSLTTPFEKSGLLTLDDGSGQGPKDKQLLGAGTKAAPMFVLVSQQETTKDGRDLDRLYQDQLKSGYEGLMVRYGSVPYQFGKRSSALLKMKPQEDSEYKIVGYVEGKGKWAGGLGALVCQTKNGDEFQVTPSTTDKQKADFWRRKKDLIGLMLTVQYQALTPQGIPRFPTGKAIRGKESKSDWM